MDPFTKRVLRELKAILVQNDDSFVADYNDRKIYNYDTGETANLPDVPLKAYLEYMQEQGYLRFFDDQHFYFSLTVKGIHPEYFARKEFLKIFLVSFVLPVCVSAITTVVTLWLKGLLPVP